MSNIRTVYDRHDKPVYEYKSLSGDVDYLDLAKKHGLPLLDVDTDDSNRLVSIVEEVTEYGFKDYYGRPDSHTRRSFDNGETAARWRSQMWIGGAFDDKYWNNPNQGGSAA